MNLFKLTTALLAGAALTVSAVPNPRGAVNNGNNNAVREVNLDDDNNVFRILMAVRDGDRPEEFGLEGCSVAYTPDCLSILNFMTTMKRHVSLGYFLERLRFEDAAKRNRVLTHVLHCVTNENSLEMARVVLAQEFEIQRDDSHFWWSPGMEASWDLDAWKGLIAEHPERAASLTPRPEDMYTVKKAADALFLIDLALYCDEISGAVRFDPTAMLCRFLFDTRLGDADMAAVVGRLLELGAARNDAVWDLLARYHPDHVQSLELLLQF